MDRGRLYREVGEATHLAQTLEVIISALVSILNRHFHAAIDEKQLILAEDRRTLGQLIQEIKKHATLDQAAIEALSEALEARNYVAHHFFIRNVEAFSSNAACAAALTLLDKRAKQIAIATAIMSAFVQGFCEALKINPSDVLIR